MARERISDNHPLRDFFRNLVHNSVSVRMGLNDSDVENYLSGLITEFIHADASLLEEHDRHVDDLVEMLYEGDVLLGAESFDQERKVHKHIGDYIMFWGGVFPEHLDLLRRSGRPTGLIDHVAQGKASYYLVSTFEHGDYASESAIFRKLSQEFETYLFALHLVRDAWSEDGGDWSRGFRA
jgi:hypothetical protein